MHKLINGIFVALGMVCLALGAIGAVLPILPTVPFLIGALLCFAKGSEKFYNWFTKTKIYKNNLQSFVEKRSMTRKQKAWALGMMTGMILLATYFVPVWQGKLGLIAVIVFNYIYFAVGIRTISQEEADEMRRELEERWKAEEKEQS